MRVFFLVLCAGATFSCTRPAKMAVQADSAIPSVSVARVQRQDLQRDLVLSAEFRPDEEVDLHAKVAGYLKEIPVDVGDRVQAGQLIATLEIPEMVDEGAQAEATRRRSEAELLHAQSELARDQSAHEAAHLNFQRLDDVMKVRPALVARQEIDNAIGERPRSGSASGFCQGSHHCGRTANSRRSGERAARPYSASLPAHHSAFRGGDQQTLRRPRRADPGRYFVQQPGDAAGSAL